VTPAMLGELRTHSNVADCVKSGNDPLGYSEYTFYRLYWDA